MKITAIITTAVISTTILNTNTVHAVGVSLCDPDEAIFGSTARLDLDIRKSTSGIVDSIPGIALSKTVGGSPKEVVSCGAFIADSAGSDGIATFIDNASGECVVVDEEFCAGLKAAYETPRTSSGELMRKSRAYHNAGGSLAGLVGSLDVALKEPPPVNLAYQWNRQVEKLPFGGTALAAPGDFNAPFLETIYGLWEISRDVALGALGIIGIVLGIMMMTRKQINPQTVVTLQYAIPKVVIAVLLIVFSYTIGATIATFAWSLSFSGGKIVETLAEDSSIAGAIELDKIGLVYAFVLAFIYGLVITAGTSGAAGPVVFAVLVGGLIACLVIYLLALLKMVTLYLRLVQMLLTAPFTFLVGTIPGYEETTSKWFKKSLVTTLGILAISAIIKMTRIMGGALMINEMSDINTTTVLASILSPFLMFFIYIYGFNQARKAPDKIEAALLDTRK